MGAEGAIRGGIGTLCVTGTLPGRLSSELFASATMSVWDPEEVCKNVCKNGSAKGAKVSFDLHTPCD
jgi:hypothetical protein